MWRNVAKCAVSLALALAAVAASAAPSGAANADGTEWWQTQDARQMTQWMNGDRSWRGLPVIPVDGVMSSNATIWSHAQATWYGTLVHQNMNSLKAQINCPVVAENVGMSSASLWNVHVAFMYSPGHAANILGSWRVHGMGVYQHNGAYWVTETFCTW